MYMYVKLSSLVANTEGLYSTFVHDAHVAFADNVHSPSGVHFCTFVSCIDRTALTRQTTCTIWTTVCSPLHGRFHVMHVVYLFNRLLLITDERKQPNDARNSRRFPEVS